MTTQPAPLTAASTALCINEMQVSTTGSDWEFFELFGAAGTSLDGYALVGIESDAGTSMGVVDLVIDLSSLALDAGGYFLAADPNAVAAYGVSPDLAIAANSFENSTAAYFLVSGFTGTAGADLDTNNDGILDLTPWSAV
ncbi:MAG TPA: hypothetical protein VFR34_14600, partial [Paracoccaceae bacterium]|nr:hypothetical protein [Paracoccaceae bacterium]